MDNSKDRGIQLVPRKSRKTYVAAWNDYVHYVNKHFFLDIDNPEVILLYFENLRASQCPKTMTKIWSMLKKCFMAFRRVNCKEIRFEIVSKWVQVNGDGYYSKQAAIFTKAELMRFLKQMDITLLKYQLAVGLMWYGM